MEIKSEANKESSDEEMLDIVDQPSFQESVKDASMTSASSGKRGRPRIPLKWSRIIDVDSVDGIKPKAFDIDDDFKSLGEELKQQKRRQKKEWQPLFHPKHWWKDNELHDLQQNLLDRWELVAMGCRASDRRKIFLERAHKHAQKLAAS